MIVDTIFTRDSVLISWLPGIRPTDWVETYETGGTRPLGTVGTIPIRFTTNSTDGGYYFKVGIVREWRERAPQLLPITLSGIVLDDATGRPVSFCGIFVHESHLSAWSDTSGHFEMSGKHRGDLGIVACADGYLNRELRVGPKQRKIVIRLKR